MARLHVIFYDSNLCHVANLLKVGVLQIVLAMIEAEDVDTSLLLDDPLAAVATWSRDPELGARVPTCDGRSLTAVELQLLFLERARAFVERGGCDGIVPRAGEIVALWEDTLAKLAERDFAALAGRLDWVLKRAAIERAFALRPDLDWTAPAAKQLDLAYSDLDPSRGLYWKYEPSTVERVVTDDEIERFVVEPPADTRAWGRAMLLRLGGDLVVDVDWDFVKFRTEHGWWSGVRKLDLADPSGFGRAAFFPVLARSASLEEVLEELEREDPPRNGELNGGEHHGDPAKTETAGPAARPEPRQRRWN
jgi:proteasome accessory factor A